MQTNEKKKKERMLPTFCDTVTMGSFGNFSDVVKLQPVCMKLNQYTRETSAEVLDAQKLRAMFQNSRFATKKIFSVAVQVS